MEKKQSQIPKARTGSLLSMAAKVVLKEGKTLLQNHADKRLLKMMEQADIIVRHVGQLKGAAMKAVQMLTVEAQDFIPPEVLEILEKLQSQAPPISDEVMIQCIKDELGEEKFKQLKNLSSEPIASASMGQVYRAQIDGRDVAIKVQYPEIADSIDSDLDTLKSLVKALHFITNKSINMNDLFEEVRRILVLETNYLNEAQLLQKYKDNFKGYTNYVVPDVFNDFTTRKVITLSFEEGLEFSQWTKTNPSLEQRQKVGDALLNLYMIEFFDNQLVQTDPNPANFLINDKEQLVLLDFGATLDYTDDFVALYKDLITTVFTGSSEQMKKKVIDLNFLSSKESDDTINEFVEFLKLSLVPFDENSQPFDFSQMEYTQLVRKRALFLTKKIKYSAPPRELIFLHRKLGGIFQLLRKLEIQANLTPFRDKLIA